MTINAEVLETTMSYIEANEGEWNQRDWSCCFAGITCRLQGGARYFIPEQAQQILGLDLDQFHELTHGGNSMEDLRVLVDGFKALAVYQARAEKAATAVVDVPDDASSLTAELTFVS